MLGGSSHVSLTTLVLCARFKTTVVDQVGGRQFVSLRRSRRHENDIGRVFLDDLESKRGDPMFSYLHL
jgi:hypothetical protein